jgi:5-methylcytosine-specific restriction protein A
VLDSKSDNWTIDELEGAVRAYIDMRQKEANNICFTKKLYNTKLSKQYGRTENSYEYRMQHISYVYSLMGRIWIKGLRPAKNVGARVSGEIEALINKIEGQLFPLVAEFQSTVDTLKKKKPKKPTGTQTPKTTSSMNTQFRRDPEVVAWVLYEANGVCECCNNDAPFTKEDEAPFLEVHHLRRLADNGSDTVTNAVAICPNCHRELHYGKEKNIILQSIYNKVGRLIVE